VTQRSAQLFDVAVKLGKLRHGYSPPTRIATHNIMILLTQ
jgi:hypothetical protein